MNNSITQNEFNQHLGHGNAEAQPKIDDSLIDRFKRITSVSEVLRIFGACAVIASLLLFMLEGWSEGNDLNRYFKLLGQTGLLTVAGLMMSFVIKEFKGARIFFGLGLISAVTNFTILGALIYSLVPLDGLLGHYPKAVTWTVGSSSQFLMVCVGAIALLTLLARFSYSIFARKIAGQLTLSFLVLNALLLIPMRSTLAVSLLTVVAVLLATGVVKKLRGESDSVLTPETKFAFATLFIPGLIIIGRAMSLYHVDEVFFLTLCGLAYYALRCLEARRTVESKNKQNAIPLLAMAQYGLAFVIAVLATQLLPNWLDDFAAVSFSVIMLALTADRLAQSYSKRAGSVMLNITSFLLIAMNVMFAFASPLLAVTLASLTMCILVLLFANYAHAQVNNSNVARMIALFGTVITLLLAILKLVAWVNMSSWMSIGLIGMALIVVGSSYERFGLKLSSIKAVIKPKRMRDEDSVDSTPNSLNV